MTYYNLEWHGDAVICSHYPNILRLVLFMFKSLKLALVEYDNDNEWLMSNEFFVY